MDISTFARFKGGFTPPTIEDGPEGLEKALEEPATYLAAELAAAGFECSTPEWRDFEYEIPCSAGGRRYRLSVSFDSLDWEWFEVSYVPNLGALSRLFGKSEAAEMAELSRAVDAVLRKREGVLDLRWYREPLGNPEKGFAHHPEGVPS